MRSKWPLGTSTWRRVKTIRTVLMLKDGATPLPIATELRGVRRVGNETTPPNFAAHYRRRMAAEELTQCEMFAARGSKIRRVGTMMLLLLAVPCQGVDEETKSVIGRIRGVDDNGIDWGGQEAKFRAAFGGVASVSQMMNKFKYPNEKDFEFGHRANSMYLPPAPSKLHATTLESASLPSCISLFSNTVSRWAEIGAGDPGRGRQQI